VQKLLLQKSWDLSGS